MCYLFVGVQLCMRVDLFFLKIVQTNIHVFIWNIIVYKKKKKKLLKTIIDIREKLRTENKMISFFFKNLFVIIVIENSNCATVMAIFKMYACYY